MRINKFIAQAASLSRRAADEAIAAGRVQVNGRAGQPGADVSGRDTVTLDGRPLTASAVKTTTVVFHKPVGYVVSRNGQGSSTIYDLLPPALHNLNPVGRLDKDSSGLLLLTTDGELANRLTHPRYAKEKVYDITLDKRLAAADRAAIEQGLPVEDYVSRLQLKPLPTGNGGTAWQVTMHEGKNRQIRRTFAARGYDVTGLHRTQFGDYKLGALRAGTYRISEQ